MQYSPMLVQPMRAELSDHGFRELMTADEVDAFMDKEAVEGALVVINSVCGCAAGQARPGARKAVGFEVRPAHLATVFAGQDAEATARMRGHFADVPPSSPSMALFKDGELVYFVPRHRIENRTADDVAADLQSAFLRHFGD